MTSTLRLPRRMLLAFTALLALAVFSATALAPAADASGKKSGSKNSKKYYKKSSKKNGKSSWHKHGNGYWKKNRNASLSLVHGIPGDSLGAAQDLPVQVRVYRLFDNTKVFDDVIYKTVAGPLEVRSGWYRIQVRVNGTSIKLTRWTYLSRGENVSAVAYLTDSGRLSDPAGKPSPKLGVFTNDVSDTGAGNARVIVRHLADAPAVDVLAGGAPLINALSNPDAAAAVVPQGTYPIEVVADADNSISAFGPADLKFDAGTTTVVYAVGSFFDGSFTPLLQTFPNS